MFPINDDVPTYSPTPAHYIILGICIVVFLIQITFGDPAAIINAYGMRPAVVFGQVDPAAFGAVSAWLSLITSQFIHGGWMHIISNMVFLWVFGDNVEEAFGSIGFVFFYIACGIAACFAQGFAEPGSIIPMVGASGAISGIMGAYLWLFPRARVVTVVFMVIITALRIPAVWFIAGWFAFQVINAVTSFGSLGVTGGTAFLAHVGGFVAGLAFAVIVNPRRRPTQPPRPKGP